MRPSSYGELYARFRRRGFSTIAANNAASAILRERAHRTKNPGPIVYTSRRAIR